MHHLFHTISVLALALSVKSHIYMGLPPTFMEDGTSIDDIISPMNGGPTHPDQWPFPCKGFHLANAETQPEVVWKAGDTVKFQLFDNAGLNEARMGGDGAVHSGGSCQISFSYDRGLTWVVVQSFEGDCPRVRSGQKGSVTNEYDPNQDYFLRIPETLPSGDYVIVAWTWINATGNREFYMSCSPVRILGSGPSTNVTPEGHPLLIANLKPLSGEDTQSNALSQCITEQGTSIEYPEKYKGMNAVIRAPIALNLQPFPGGNDSTCGSDNAEIMRMLGGSSKAESSPTSSTISTLSLPEPLSPLISASSSMTSTTMLSAGNFTPATMTEGPSGEGSSRCTCVETEALAPESTYASAVYVDIGTGSVNSPITTQYALSTVQPDEPSGTAFQMSGLGDVLESSEQTTTPNFGSIFSGLHSMLTDSAITSNAQTSMADSSLQNGLHSMIAGSPVPSSGCGRTVTETVELKASSTT